MWTAILGVLTALIGAVGKWWDGKQGEVARLEKELADALGQAAYWREQVSAAEQRYSVLLADKERRIQDLEIQLADADVGDLFDGVFSVDPKSGN